MDAWIPVVGTLLGAVIGGGIAFISSWFQTRSQESANKRAIALEKLEHAHGVVRSIRLNYRSAYSFAMGRLATGDLSSKSDDVDIIEIDKLKMLIGMYFPKLDPYIDKLESARSAFSKIFVNVLLPLPSPAESRRELMDELSEVFNEVNQSSSDLLDAIANLAAEHIQL